MFRWAGRKKRSAEDFRQEIESHLALEADQIRDTTRCADPEAQAHRSFGNMALVRESWYERQHWMFFDHLARDLRHGVRQIRHRPGFSAIVILTLAFGIGATSAIYSIVNAVLLRPLPYRDPYTLAMVFGDDPARELHEGRVSLLNFADWKSQNHSFADLTVFTGQTFLLGASGNAEAPERMRSARVPADFWNVLGVEPELGRVFTQEEEHNGARVAVLSHALWTQIFGGSPGAIGSVLRMDNRSYTVIGVMPSLFQFPFADTKVWEPLTAHPYWQSRDRAGSRSDATWFALGRIKSGLTWQQVREDMNGIAARLRASYPGDQMPASIVVAPLQAQATEKFRLSLLLLFGAVFLILVIACTNVAGLMLARSTVREREFVLRRALGGRPLRLGLQLTIETLVLAAFGGAVGLLLARAAIHLIIAFGPADIPRLREAGVDGPVLLFTAGMVFLAAMLASVWPALQASRTQAGSRQWTTTATRRISSALVVGEFALAIVLLTGAGLLVNSFVRLTSVEPGFRADHLLRMRIDLHVGRTADQESAWFEQAIARAEGLPGVSSAGAITGFLRTDPEDAVQIEGRQAQKPGPCEDWVAGHFFETAGAPLRKGRLFNDLDSRHSLPVAVINESMARAYWSNDDPLGKRFRFRPVDQWLTVVGVTGDMRRQGMDHEALPQVFLPHAQGTENMMDIIVRTNADPAALAPVVRGRIQAMDRNVAKFGVATVTDELSIEMGDRRFDTFLLGCFGCVSLALSALGIYGLLHHLVAQRTGEIGIHMALGARPQSVMRLIMRQGMLLAASGAVMGLGAALLLSPSLSKLLYGVGPTDFVTFVCSGAVLLAVAGVACWFPAWRAARIDPVRALRHE